MASGIIGRVLLGKYKVEDYLGGGGMGEVYRVWDNSANCSKAMKIMRSELTDDPSMLKIFKREARALAKLAHDNIIPFYGLYETDDFIFMLQKYIDGPTLKNFIKNSRNSKISEEEALIILKAVTKALGYAHKQVPVAVVHCDVKPDNVMIDGGGNIYLGDFGVVRHADSDITTVVGAGAPAYMSPEQIREEHVSPATDVYSLGVMAFEMFAGQRPFLGNEKSTANVAGQQGEKLRYAHVNVNPPDPRSINPSIQAELSSVILRALSKKPEQRQQNAQIFFEEICSALRITPESIPDRIPIQGHDFPPPPPPPPPPPHHKKPWVYVAIGGVFLITLVFIMAGGSNPPPPITLGSPTEYMAPETVVLQTIEEARSTEVVKSPISTPVPTSTERIVPTKTKRTYSSCPGAEPQRVIVGDTVKVCTKVDHLFVRSGPGSNMDKIFRLITGTTVKIVDGPRCNDNYSWWLVRVSAGTVVTKIGVNDNFNLEKDYEGWVREGSDEGWESDVNKDQYFICVVN